MSEYEDQQAQTDPALSTSVPYTPSFRDKRTLPSKGSSQQLRAPLAPQITSQLPSHASSKDARFLRYLRHCGLRGARPGHSRSNRIPGLCTPYIAFAISPTHNTLIQDVSSTGVVESRAVPRDGDRGFALIVGDAEPLRSRQTDGTGHGHPAGAATESLQRRGDGNGHDERRRNDGNGHNERRQDDGNGHDERRRNDGNGHDERDVPAQD